MGKLDTVIQFPSNSAKDSFFVVDGNHQSLLSFIIASKLGFIKIIPPVNNVTAVANCCIDYNQLMDQ